MDGADGTGTAPGGQRVGGGKGRQEKEEKSKIVDLHRGKRQCVDEGHNA